jgi:hypothetical protein
LWAAFGKSEQDEIESKTKSWFKELLDKPNYAAALLDTLYDSATGLVEPSVAGMSAPDDVVVRLATIACGNILCVSPVCSTMYPPPAPSGRSLLTSDN